tara:strand:- start:2783 stop:3472 length:690 start_codon:yes stop_codon:yes gene_type:complete
MLNLENVTLIIVSSIDLDNSIKALEYSCKGINFGAVKLVSHEKPNNLPPNIKFEYIDRMDNIDEYSYNMIYKLGEYVETEFVLVIQSDGYVVNPSSWRDEFLEYDYIGAPFPLPNDSFSYRDANGTLFRVGNGGFSLRSKKLVDLPNKLGLEWKSFHGYYNEDGYICVNYRHIFEENGVKYAPLDVAKYFSHESYIPEIEGITPFGFHGKSSKWNNVNEFNTIGNKWLK